MLFSTQSQQSQNLVEGEALPCSFVRFIFAVSGWHQLAVSAISVAVFLLDAAPIETQRRIIDAAVKGGTASTILTLIAAQCALIVAFGLSKLVMNVYRAWLGESATRALRVLVEERLARTDVPEDQPNSGTGLAMIFAEADDVGAFVGSSISEPIVEAGFLISVFAYLAALESRMALLSLAVLAPQFVFVPLMQRAINRRVARRTQTLRQFGNDMLAAVPFIGNGRNVERLDEVFALDMGVIKLKFSLNFLMNLTYSFGSILVLGIGSLLVIRGQAEIATVITFLSATGKVVDPWNDVVDWARNFSVAAVKYELIVRGIGMIGGDGAPKPKVSLAKDRTSVD